MIRPVTIVVALAFVQGASPVSSIRLTPHTAGTISLDSLKGNLRRMAWAADGSQLYLETFDQNKDASPKDIYHYLVSPTNATVTKTDSEPDWAATYWAWKSAQSSQDDEKFSIELLTEKKRASATSTPMGGDYARGGSGSDAAGAAGGVSMSEMGAAANQSQLNDVRTLKLKGEVIGEWINLPIAPGLTFGWAPRGAGAVIAYADKGNGKLMLMDNTGAKKKIDDTNKISLPCWSVDGKQLAWLEASGKKTYTLVVATVTR